MKEVRERERDERGKKNLEWKLRRLAAKGFNIIQFQNKHWQNKSIKISMNPI